MKLYKEQLLTSLSNSGWELVEIDDFTDWWAEEHWRIASRKHQWGLELWLSYLVDPSYDGSDKSSAVWAVHAATSKPDSRPVSSGNEIATMYLSKGHYREEMHRFVEQIDGYRDDLGQGGP